MTCGFGKGTVPGAPPLPSPGPLRMPKSNSNETYLVRAKGHVLVKNMWSDSQVVQRYNVLGAPPSPYIGESQKGTAGRGREKIVTTISDKRHDNLRDFTTICVIKYHDNLRQFTTIYDIFCPVPFLPSPFGFRRIQNAPYRMPKNIAKKRTWYQARRHVCAKARLRNPEATPRSGYSESTSRHVAVTPRLHVLDPREGANREKLTVKKIINNEMFFFFTVYVRYKPWKNRRKPWKNRHQTVKKSEPKIHHFFTVSFSPFTSSWDPKHLLPRRKSP